MGVMKFISEAFMCSSETKCYHYRASLAAILLHNDPVRSSSSSGLSLCNFVRAFLSRNDPSLSTSTQSPFMISLTSSRLLLTPTTSTSLSSSPTPNLWRLSVMLELLDRLNRISVLTDLVLMQPRDLARLALLAAVATTRGLTMG